MRGARTFALLGAVTLLGGAAGCGKKSEPPPPAPPETAAKVEDLASEVKDLQLEIARLGARRLEREASKTEAVPELEAKEQEARALGVRIEGEAAPQEAAKEPLVDACEDLAAAAGALITIEASGEQADVALERAQESLDNSQTRLDEAAEDMLPRVPPDKRPEVEELKKDPPKLPSG
jgi:hypothetical protein